MALTFEFFLLLRIPVEAGEVDAARALHLLGLEKLALTQHQVVI